MENPQLALGNYLCGLCRPLALQNCLTDWCFAGIVSNVTSSHGHYLRLVLQHVHVPTRDASDCLPQFGVSCARAFPDLQRGHGMRI